MHRKVTGATLVLAMAASAPFAARALAATTQTTPPTGLKVFAGYIDTFHPRKGLKHPVPWRHNPTVMFKGCNYFHPSRCPKRMRYDAGALRLDNNTTAPMLVTHASVRIAACTFRPWPKLHVTVPVGKKLILTETGGKPPCHTANPRNKDNFDTSETNRSSTRCTVSDREIPAFNVTVNGQPLTYRDVHRVLNKQGKDPGYIKCGSHGETHRWVAISP